MAKIGESGPPWFTWSILGTLAQTIDLEFGLNYHQEGQQNGGLVGAQLCQGFKILNVYRVEYVVFKFITYGFLSHLKIGEPCLPQPWLGRDYAVFYGANHTHHHHHPHQHRRTWRLVAYQLS